MKTADTITSIMQLVGADTLPDKFAEIDLRFFRKIYLADTYNGVGSCWDGVEYSAILYGNRVVWQSAIYRDPNNWTHRQPFDGNNELYYKMSDVAQRYLQILAICRTKYFEEKSEEDAGEYWDCVDLTAEVLKTLETHPQYRKISKDFGLELEKVDSYGLYRIGCSKRHKTAA